MKKIVIALLIMMSPIWAQWSIYGGLQNMSASGSYIVDGSSVMGYSIGAAYAVNDKIVVGGGMSQRGFEDDSILFNIYDMHEEFEWTVFEIWCAYTFYSTDKINLWAGPSYASAGDAEYAVTLIDPDTGDWVETTFDGSDVDGDDFSLMVGLSTPVGESMALHVGYKYGLTSNDGLDDTDFSFSSLNVSMSYGF